MFDVEPPTQFEGLDEPPTQMDGDNAVAAPRCVIGGITARGAYYPLKMGRNVIGRKATSSKADIQIPCDDNIMSREHIVIDVEQTPGQGVSHTLSLYKEVKNRTCFGSEEMKFGEKRQLCDGDKIHLPGCDVIFSIPDEDKTLIS